MRKSPHPLRLHLAIAGLLATLCSTDGRSESEFERGYREGYGRGFQDGQAGDRVAPPTRGRATQGRSGIVIIRAEYGDGRKSCDLTSWAAGQFNNRTSAEVVVTNGLCGDPAPGKRKSLKIEYYCHGEVKSDDAYEHRQLSISCH